jgi:hypothetical protein
MPGKLLRLRAGRRQRARFRSAERIHVDQEPFLDRPKRSDPRVIGRKKANHPGCEVVVGILLHQGVFETDNEVNADLLAFIKESDNSDPRTSASVEQVR